MVIRGYMCKIDVNASFLLLHHNINLIHVEFSFCCFVRVTTQLIISYNYLFMIITYLDKNCSNRS